MGAAGGSRRVDAVLNLGVLLSVELPEIPGLRGWRQAQQRRQAGGGNGVEAESGRTCS